MTKSVNEREIVLAVLMEVTEKGVYSHLILRDVLGKYQYLEKKERSFITRVTEGTLEHMIEMDYILDQFSKVRVSKMKPVIRNILRSSVYQLRYMDSVPDHAVCSEAVKLAVRKGFSGLKGYVNGVLRSIARNLDQVKYPQDRLERMSVQYSMPRWILELWRKSYTEDLIETMLDYFQQEKKVTVRCCLDRILPEKLKQRLEKQNIRVTEHPWLKYAFTIEGYDYLENIPEFREGLFTVQDISSMLVGEIADPPARASVIDVCAAPGGKALHVSEKLRIAAGTNGDAGCVEARDLTEYKTELIRENVARLRAGNVRAVCMDASVTDPASEESADLVIADLPCSGLGVLGRKPDLKYRITSKDLEDLAGLQRKILSCVQSYVKEGGELLYSTCTVNPSENIENVHWFLQQYPEFCLGDIRERLCRELADSVEEEGCIQLLPGIHKCDGFFIARLIKGKGQG